MIRSAKNQRDAGMSAILGMVLNEYGGRAVLTPGSVKDFMGQCDGTRHFIDIKEDGKGQLVVTSLHELEDGRIDRTHIGIDYEREYPKGCLSGLQ
jgi:hypothetical protein